MTAPLHPKISDAILNQFRALNVSWGVDKEGILHLTVPSNQSVRKAVNLIMNDMPKAAVIAMEEHGARIQLA